MARLLPYLTPLIHIRNADFGRGGRELSFNEAVPHKQRRTDSEIIEQLRESISDMLS
jgi:hypothetical protein